MKHFAIYLTLLVLMAACGAGEGSGGSGGTGTDGKTIPNLPGGDLLPEPTDEPYVSGAPINHKGRNWSITLDEINYSAKSTNDTDNIYYFNTNTNEAGSFETLAAANDNVSLMGIILTPNDGGAPIFGFGMNGDFTAPPSNGSAYFSGTYASLSPQGDKQGAWDMEIYIDFQNVSNSYGIDRNGGEDIHIHFASIEGDAISGSISDLNHDFNVASFSFFGDNASTIAGGYSNETGAGMLIGER